MQIVYVCTITAGHDFNSTTALKAFASRTVADRWGGVEATRLNAEAFAHDGWDSYSFSHSVRAMSFDGAEA